ncbi:MAG: hypothetical protein HQL19_08265, partial [Candidatus Omnitrophica bacterium]|nr:hypothetical protein [Candidatus Omnitrophota bacterium]
MAEHKKPAVSRSTLKRLPLYLHLLENLEMQGQEYVSCTQIAKDFDFDPTQVRKDLEVTGAVGLLDRRLGDSSGLADLSADLGDGRGQFLGSGGHGRHIGRGLLGGGGDGSGGGTGAGGD